MFLLSPLCVHVGNALTVRRTWRVPRRIPTGVVLSASTPIVAPVPAGPEAVKTSAPGFTAVAKAMTPAVVNITSRAVRTRDSRGPGNRNPEEFFGFPFPFGPEGPSGHQGPFGPQGPMEPREHRGGGMGSGVIVSPGAKLNTPDVYFQR